ncbi:hypothetical protein QUB70_11720 [Microcoleus sp. A003_D6]
MTPYGNRLWPVSLPLICSIPLKNDRPFDFTKGDRPFDTKKCDRPSLRKSRKGRSTIARCQKERSPFPEKKS